MKAIYTIIAALLLIASGCSSSYRSSTSYDDVYYDGSEVYLEDIKQEEPRTSARNEGNKQSSKYESEEEYGYEDYSGDGEEYEEGGNTYITNNYYGDYYDEPYDYFYSSRIRRFSRPYLGFSYFGSCYTDYRWYDPYYSGVSIYVSWGNPGWGWRDPFFYSYRPYSWYYRPWYDPYYSSFYSGYNYGYWNGFNDGFFYGSNYYSGFNGYGYNSGYNNYGYSETYTPTDYYYGPRFANNSGSNSGMRGQRSSVQYGKNDGSGKGGNRTINSTSANSGQLASESRNGNLNKARNPGRAGNSYFENQKGNELSKHGTEAVSGIRTVSPTGSGSTQTLHRQGEMKAPRGSKGSLITGSSNTGSSKSGKLSPRSNRQNEWNRYKSRQYNSNSRTESPSGSGVRPSYERNGSRYPSGNVSESKSRRTGGNIRRSEGVNRRTGVRQERSTPGRNISSPERKRGRSISSPRQLQERSSPSPRRSTTSPKRSIKRNENSTPRSSSPSNSFSAPSRSRSYSSPSRSGGSRSSSNYSSPSRSSSSGSGSSSSPRLRGPR